MNKLYLLTLLLFTGCADSCSQQVTEVTPAPVEDGGVTDPDPAPVPEPEDTQAPEEPTVDPDPAVEPEPAPEPAPEPEEELSLEEHARQAAEALNATGGVQDE